MKIRWLWLPVCLPLLLLLCGTALAETVHLNTGESIQGKIVRVDPDSISMESDKGFGVIQIKRSDITLIEYEENERDLSRLFGIGYYHRSTPSNVSIQAAEYGVDALSLKMWFSSTDSVDLLLGFYSSSNKQTTIYEVFSLDVRYASVFKRQANLDVYYGGSLGYLSVTDKTGGNNIEDTGYAMRVFLGVELIFVTLPNLGISSEIGIGTQSVGDNSTTNLSATTFPTFSIRYYY